MKPRVLLVDDDEHLLRGLTRVLRDRFDIVTAASGTEGIERIASAEAPFAVVVSDFQMPFMNGAQFLKHARSLAPDATRVLLTGQAAIGDAASVVNEGGIFRLLLKPVASDVLVVTLDESVEQHRLVHAERDLLQHTLAGSVKAMSELLSLAAPAAFAKATRLRELSSLIFDALEREQPWHVSVAVMLSQIGAIALPPPVLEHFNAGALLSPDEEAMVSRLPALAEHILSEVPRLEDVREAIRLQDVGCSAGAELVPLGARVLRLVRDYDELESGGVSAGDAISRLNGRGAAYDRDLVTALARGLAARGDRTLVQVPLRDLEVGMTLADDIFTAAGLKLVPRGHTVTTSLLERITNFSHVPPGIIEPLCVFAPRAVKQPSWPGSVEVGRLTSA